MLYYYIVGVEATSGIFRRIYIVAEDDEEAKVNAQYFFIENESPNIVAVKSVNIISKIR